MVSYDQVNQPHEQLSSLMDEFVQAAQRQGSLERKIQMTMKEMEDSIKMKEELARLQWEIAKSKTRRLVNANGLLKLKIEQTKAMNDATYSSPPTSNSKMPYGNYPYSRSSSVVSIDPTDLGSVMQSEATGSEYTYPGEEVDVKGQIYYSERSMNNSRIYRGRTVRDDRGYQQEYLPCISPRSRSPSYERRSYSPSPSYHHGLGLQLYDSPQSLPEFRSTGSSPYIRSPDLNSPRDVESTAQWSSSATVASAYPSPRIQLNKFPKPAARPMEDKRSKTSAKLLGFVSPITEDY